MAAYFVFAAATVIADDIVLVSEWYAHKTDVIDLINDGRRRGFRGVWVVRKMVRYR